MEDNQLESAATGSESVDTDETSLIEGVEPSSFRAEVTRLLVQLRSSTNDCLSWTYPDKHTKF